MNREETFGILLQLIKNKDVVYLIVNRYWPEAETQLAIRLRNTSRFCFLQMLTDPHDIDACWWRWTMQKLSKNGRFGGYYLCKHSTAYACARARQNYRLFLCYVPL